MFQKTTPDNSTSPILQQPDSEQGFTDILQAESNQAIHKGSIYASIFGLLGALFMLLGKLMGMPGDFLIPAIWACLAGLYAALIAWLSRKGQLSSFGQIMTVVGYVSVPTLLYGIAHFLLPMGAATYITGPPSYLYMFMILLTGFMFNEKFSAVAGIVAGVQYFLVYLLAEPHFREVSCSDPMFIQDLTGGLFYFFKALLMIFTGFAVGILAVQHKGLIQRILSEECQRKAIDRLFGTFVSPEIKAQIMQLREGAPGERIEAVILFADIRSFTTLCEKIQPEIVVNLLNTYFERIGPCINRNGGVIDKYIGDAVMATFGAVVPLENSSLSAVTASREMLFALSDLNHDFSRQGLPELAIGIGLHRGDVILGAIGSKNRREFTVIGDTVNTASRLESMCKSCDSPLIISEAVLLALPNEHREKFLPHGKMELKGKSNKVGIFGIAQ
ncbi:MAG: adenylate/guanylate cyclase domain-containing protein [Candidatus Riflebacteria bacterium]|nr:adenylate/guanylate cyclase domain-containing protein [Candidatus Riflebacteria bacterium]